MRLRVCGFVKLSLHGKGAAGSSFHSELHGLAAFNQNIGGSPAMPRLEIFLLFWG